MASSSPLPDLAFITLECTILPFLLCAWTNSLTLSALTVLFFEIVIREGFGVNSPFPYPNPNDEFDGRRIMNAIYPIYIIAFAFLGKILIILLKLPTMFRLSALFPSSFIGGNDKKHYSKLFLFVSLAWLLLISLGTYLTYKILLDHSQPLVAVIWMNLFPLALFIVGFLIFYFWKSIWHSFILLVQDHIDGATKKTAQVVLLFIFIIIGVCVIFGNLIVSLLLYFKNDVNWTALSAPVIWFFLLAFIIGMRFLKNFIMKKYGKIEKKKPKEENEQLQRDETEESTGNKPNFKNKKNEYIYKHFYTRW